MKVKLNFINSYIFSKETTKKVLKLFERKRENICEIEKTKIK